MQRRVSIGEAFERRMKAQKRHGQAVGEGGCDILGGWDMLNSMLLNTGHLADLLNISPSTVKKYSGMYGKFLSESGRPQEDGAHRLFDTDDVRVLAYVVQQTKLGEKHDNIIMSIANGARADVPAQYNDFTLTMDKSDQIMMLQTRIMQLEARVLELEGEHDARIRAEAERDLLRELLREAMGKGAT